MANWPPVDGELASLRRTMERRVDRSCGPDACWPWPGAATKGGYGVIAIKIADVRRVYLTHRLALLFAGVSLSREQFALHSCDNPICCNPRHLRSGTHQDNAADREARNRRVPARGERAAKAKLTADQVIRIRHWDAVGFTRRHMAEFYGVSVSLINAIVWRQTWKHI